MNKFEYTIKDKLGIHARPAGMLAKKAKEFESVITIRKGEKEVNAAKIMALMSLGVKCGDNVAITAEGPDEDRAIQQMKDFFEANL